MISATTKFDVSLISSLSANAHKLFDQSKAWKQQWIREVCPKVI